MGPFSKHITSIVLSFISPWLRNMKYILLGEREVLKYIFTGNQGLKPLHLPA